METKMRRVYIYLWPKCKKDKGYVGVSEIIYRYKECGTRIQYFIKEENIPEPEEIQ